METERSPKANIGSASIVVIFSVLCLTVFAVLSLLSANSEKKMADKTAMAISNYYAADLMGAETAQELITAYKEDVSGENLINVASDYDASVMETDTGFFVYFVKTVDENQELYVELDLTQGIAQILSWKVRSVKEWEPNDDLPVWSGVLF